MKPKEKKENSINNKKDVTSDNKNKEKISNTNAQKKPKNNDEKEKEIKNNNKVDNNINNKSKDEQKAKRNSIFSLKEKFENKNKNNDKRVVASKNVNLNTKTNPSKLFEGKIIGCHRGCPFKRYTGIFFHIS